MTGGNGDEGTPVTKTVSLREVKDDDLPHFFDHQRDARASYMAAFTAKDPSDEAAFFSHWRRILGNASNANRTIVDGDDIVGYIASFEDEDRREITYWIAPAAWGRGYATEALRQFLTLEATRPLYARVATDNRASFRVLEKNGFEPISETISYANARDAETAETILKLL